MAKNEDTSKVPAPQPSGDVAESNKKNTPPRPVKSALPDKSADVSNSEHVPDAQDRVR